MDKVAKLRLGFLYLCFVVLFSLVGFRLVKLQILPNAELSELASKQFTRVGKQASFRWPIFDRNGEELAVSISSSSVFARPKLIRSRRKTAVALSEVLGGTPSKWLNRLDVKKSFIWIQRQVDEDTVSRLANFGLQGIFVEAENRRLYPNGSLAGTVIGFTDIDGNGLGGVELAKNSDLLDTGGRKREARDGRGRPSYIERGTKRNQEGRGIHLTIDRRIQNVLEEELQKTKAETRAQAVLGIVMDPQNGEILAMGQYPAFDPNIPKEYPTEHQTNRNTAYLYEPGSTMKPILFSEAIQSGLLKKDSIVDCEGGKLKIGDHVIRDAELHRPMGRIPLNRVLRVSSNIGAAKVSQILGPDRMAGALQKFGLFSPTGVELPGEVSSVPKPESFWTPMHLASAGFGQAIATTPLQMVAAYAPFANGGMLVKPTLLPNKDSNPRQVLSKSTVEIMRDMLLDVVESEEGTGKGARIAGIRVAGKTGTAQKYEPGVGYANKYFSSFIGFLPAEAPELLIGIMVDEPEGKYYAADVAVPAFQKVAERSLALTGRTRLAQQKLWDTPVAKGEIVKEFSNRISFDGVTMPDLTGAGIRESLKLLSPFAGDISVRGIGYLASQSPPAGTVLSEDTKIELNFSPGG